MRAVTIKLYLCEKCSRAVGISKDETWLKVGSHVDSHRDCDLLGIPGKSKEERVIFAAIKTIKEWLTRV